MNTLLCRICLEPNAKLCIFENSENSIHSKILFCLNEKIEDAIGFPRKICIKCNDTLDTFVNFINSYRESSLILSKQFENVKLDDSSDYEDVDTEVNIDIKEEIIKTDSTSLTEEGPVSLNFNKIQQEHSNKPTNNKALSILENNFIQTDNNKWCIKNTIKDTTFQRTGRILLKQFDDVKLEDSSEYEDFVANTEVEIDIKQEYIPTDSESITDVIVEPVKRVLRNRKQKTQTNKIASSILEGNFVWIDNKWCIKEEKDTKTRKVVKKKKINNVVKQKQINQQKVKIKKDPSKLCDLCGEVCPNSDKLAHHKKLKHFRNPIKCPNCPKILSSEYYLQCHIKRRHDVESKKYSCTMCTIAFAFQGELRSHIKHVHNKKDIPKKMFTCKTCGKVYKCPRSVIVHERSVHTGLRPAECSVCGASFYHEDYLREHMRLHTGETPYKCPICGRGYAQRGNMKSHLRNHRRSDLDPVTLSKIRPNYLKFMKP